MTTEKERFSVDLVPSMKQVQDRLRPEIINGPLKTLLTSAALTAEGTARQTAPRDTGALKRAITSEVSPLSARVYTIGNHEYHKVMEVGRRPGAKMPPPSSLAGWASRHGFPASALFVLARAIGRRGIKGRFYMRAGKNAAQAKMPSLLAAMARKIGMDFGRPF